MGVAAELARVEGLRDSGRLVALRDRLVRRLLETVPGARLTGGVGRERLPHHVSIVQRDVKADGVLLDLDGVGIAASTGSACMARTGMAAHVLRAIGCDQRESEGSLCFTFGRWTTAGDIDALLDALPPIVERLRRLAPTA
jgi:cysteine desulfurase